MKDKALHVSIGGGKYRGKKLKLPSLSTTRSTKSILKESLFNTLQFDLCDAVFVEVFGGSGSIGIEAVSRGAKHAYFIEKDAPAFGVLEENCASVDKTCFTCKRGNAFEILPKLIPSLMAPAYVYFDPPFAFREGMDDVYQACFDLAQSLPVANIRMLIFEHMHSLDMPQSLGSFVLQKTKAFGKSALSYYM
ncbi:MAG: 16S rRNA (guanine(966)-N(2))-methyltransferase RsmD [Campylobacterales bacterium]|nr:16S rRNA (guanine(966)-N(2))-methyltransferase RsmD [Campylobacterales bacterium]